MVEKGSRKTVLFCIYQNCFELDLNRFELDKNRFELDQNRFELDVKRIELDKERGRIKLQLSESWFMAVEKLSFFYILCYNYMT